LLGAGRELLRGLDVRALCNHFLTAKLRLLRSGEITPRTLDDYRATTDRLVAEFGARRLVADLRADDFDKLRSGLAASEVFSCGNMTLARASERLRKFQPDQVVFQFFAQLLFFLD
jgi:hypothetical protein